MSYTLPFTKKGQFTVPKKERDLAKLMPGGFIQFKSYDRSKNLFQIKPLPGILSIGNIMKAPKGKTALKGREEMDKNYAPA